MTPDAALAKALRAMAPEVRKATVFLSDKQVVSICRCFKYSKRNTREDLVVKIGKPNYAERQFIARCKKAGEPLPVNKVQLKPWPKSRKVAR